MRDELNVAYVTHANIRNNYFDTIGPNLNSFHPVRCSWGNVITQTIDCGMGRLASERYGPPCFRLGCGFCLHFLLHLGSSNALGFRVLRRSRLTILLRLKSC